MFSCYAYQQEGNLNPLEYMTNYYCEFNDTYILLGTVFLFLILILIWKKTLWN